MSEITNRQVNIYIETGSAQAALDVLQKKEKQLKDALQQATDPRVVAKLTAELKKLEVPIENASKKLTGKLAPSIRDISKTVQSLERDLKNLSRDDPGFNKKISQYRAAKTELEALRKQALAVNDTVNNSGGLLGKLQSQAGGIFSGIAQGFGIGLGVSAIQQLPGIIESSIDEFLQAEQAAGRLESKLKNLGRGDAFDRITRKASEMADRFKFLDNDDVIGVFDKLITYGKLTEDQMNELLPVIINFASDSKISLEESASVIIKALEGNGKALKEYGISIKDAGTASERFGVVVNELGKKVEGAADAFGNSMAGKIAIAQQRVKDLQEELGQKLLPLKVKLLEFANEVGSGFLKMASDIKTSLSLGIGLGQAGDIRRNLENIQQFAEKQAADEFAKLSGLDKADLTTQLIGRKAEQADIKQILERNKNAKKQGFEGFLSDDRVSYYQSRLTVLARLIPQIDDAVNKADDILGLKTDAGEGKGAAGAAKEAADEVSKLNAELRDLVESFDIKRLSEFQQKVLDIEKAFGKLEDRAYKTNNGDLVNRIIFAKETEIDNLRNEFLKKQVSSGPGAVDLTSGIGSIFDLVKGRTPGQALGPGSNANKKEEQTLSERISLYTDYANEVTNIFSTLSSKIAEREDQDLEADRRKTEKKKENYTRLLESNLISRKEYDRKNAIADLELERREKAVRKRQFRRDQLESSLRVGINLAEGISKALASPATAPVVIPIISALAAVQLGIIAGKKYPEFAKGGRLTGPTHKEGGMPVIDPRTGEKQAEVEGGEVILSRNTVRNNARVVNELLNSSLYRNGERISAVYGRGGRLPAINFNHASQSLQRVSRFERGGVINGTNGGGVPDETIQNLNILIAGLQQQLDKGIVAYASIQQFDKQKDRLNAIIDDVTMK